MPPLVRGRVLYSELLGHPEKHFTGIKNASIVTTWPPRNLNAEQHYLLCCEGRFCPIIVSHFKKEGDSEQAVECERGWRGGKVVGTSSCTGTVVDMNASTTRMTRLPAIQLAAPPTDVPMPSILLPGNDVLPWRLATNPDHLGIQKLIQLLEPDSPSRTGDTLLREAWASPGRDFARTLSRRGPPATLDFGSHAPERHFRLQLHPLSAK